MPKKSDETREATQMVGLQLRFREDLRARLTDAAKTSGKSLNSEIVSRLERSLDADQDTGGGVTARALRIVASEIERAERYTERSWLSDTATHEAASLLIADAIKRLRPTPQLEDITPTNTAWASKKAEVDEIVELLRRCHVLGWPNALLPSPLEPRAYPILPEEKWTMPAGEPPSDEDRQIIRERLADFQQKAEELAKLEEQMEQKMQPFREALHIGRTVHRLITAAAEA